MTLPAFKKKKEEQMGYICLECDMIHYFITNKKVVTTQKSDSIILHYDTYICHGPGPFSPCFGVLKLDYCLISSVFTISLFISWSMVQSRLYCSS